MDQHPVPRQITSFEFKLIGFLTIKQFIYLIIFIPLGFLTYVIFPIPLLNIFLGILVGAMGVAFAFLPINDRPLDVWIRNMFRRLTSPTQYQYQKLNPPIYFLRNLYFVTDPHRVMAHIQSQEMLAAYMARAHPTAASTQKQTINDILGSLPVTPVKKTPAPVTVPIAPAIQSPTANQNSQLPTPNSQLPKTPFFTGIVKNHKLIPIPGVLIYVKNDSGQTLRLLKTNPHGIFATFNPLPSGNYNFEIKDAKNTYQFDTMKIRIESINPKPLEFYSKELL